MQIIYLIWQSLIALTQVSTPFFQCVYYSRLLVLVVILGFCCCSGVSFVVVKSTRCYTSPTVGWPFKTCRLPKLNFRQLQCRNWFHCCSFCCYFMRCDFFLLIMAPYPTHHWTNDFYYSRAEGVYQSMKSKYGVHQCHLLKINSVTPNLDPTPAEEAMPDPWSNFVKKTPSVCESATQNALVF